MSALSLSPEEFELLLGVHSCKDCAVDCDRFITSSQITLCESVICFKMVPPAASQALILSVFLLCRFYDEIRTPLLFNIRIDYPSGLVEHATKTVFPNYFNGSEIVIAGKLVDRKMDQLHVEVTASNSKKFIILKTDVPVEPQKGGHGAPGSPSSRGDGKEDPNHIERLWSYLTVKELLSSWLQSDSEQEKERLRQKAQDLALTYHFLTPFTSMKLRKPVLQGGTLEVARGMSAATGPETVMQSLRGSTMQPGNTAPMCPGRLGVGP